MLYDLLVAPFLDYAFMRRALVASLALATGCAPVGVFLLLRRMSLLGDALSHAVLPGAAVGFLLGGLSLPAMGLGGFIAGLVVAVLAGLVSRITPLREDASFAAFYLISLALGVVLVSSGGSTVDLMHVLFGSVLAVDAAALVLVAAIASVTVLGFALLYRPLVTECFDPAFLRGAGGGGARIQIAFLTLVVLNLVAGFQALGTLMAVGMMMLPAVAARMWAGTLARMIAVSWGVAALSGYLGLVVSFRFDLPTGPAIVLVAGGILLVSVVIGHDSLLARRWRGRGHLRG